MTIEEIKQSSKIELIELLKLNTAIYNYDLELMATVYHDLYGAYLEHRNSLLDRRFLWQAVCKVFYKLDDEMIQAIEEVFNWYDFMLWCEDHFLEYEPVQYFIKMYEKYRSDKNSIVNLMLELVDVLSGALNDMSPESIQGLLDQLGDNLNNLPDIIKERL
jgi:hypothetical protein